MKELTLKSPGETIKFGTKLGKLLGGGDMIALTGDLGAGKTTFIKGVAKGLGVKDPDHVNSPSFVILKCYKGRIPLYHFDVYRLNDPSAMDTVGYKDYFYGEGVSAVEWAEKIEEILPDERLAIELSVTGEDTRLARITPKGSRYADIVEKLKI